MGCGQAPLRVGWWSILQICRAGLLKKGAKNGTFCELYKVLITVYKYFDDVADVAARGHTTRRACRWCRLQQPIILQQFEFWIQMVVYVIVIFARRKNKTKSMTTRCRAIFIIKWSEVYFQNYSLPWSWTDDGSKSHAFANAGNAKVSVLVSSHFFENRKRKQIKA